jgi:CRP-like cAMP-binding protein
MSIPTSHLIRIVEALAGLSEAQREAIASISEILTFTPGQVVCTAGDNQAAFYAIMHGQVKSTTMDGTLRNQYHRGDLVGAQALACSLAPGSTNVRHEETIVAVGSVKLLRYTLADQTPRCLASSARETAHANANVLLSPLQVSVGRLWEAHHSRRIATGSSTRARSGLRVITTAESTIPQVCGGTREAQAHRISDVPDGTLFGRCGDHSARRRGGRNVHTQKRRGAGAPRCLLQHKFPFSSLYSCARLFLTVPPCWPGSPPRLRAGVLSNARGIRRQLM